VRQFEETAPNSSDKADPNVKLISMGVPSQIAAVQRIKTLGRRTGDKEENRVKPEELLHQASMPKQVSPAELMWLCWRRRLI